MALRLAQPELVSGEPRLASGAPRMFAQQQVLRARAEEKAGDERPGRIDANEAGRGSTGTHACCAARSGTAR